MLGDISKSVVTAVIVSVCVGSFAVIMAYGQLTGNVSNNTEDIDTLKGVRHMVVDELNKLEVQDSQVIKRLEKLEEQEYVLRHSLTCILTVDPSSEGAQADILKCISNRNNRTLMVEPEGPIYYVLGKDGLYEPR